MATVKQHFKASEFLVLASAFPEYKKVNGTSFPVDGLYYDDSVTEAAFWDFIAANYGSGSLTINIYWYADTSTTDTTEVRWDAQIATVAPGAAVNIETKALATANSVSDAPGTTAHSIQKATITLSNTDSIAADDECHIRIARDHDHVDDDMVGDAVLKSFEVTYSDT